MPSLTRKLSLFVRRLAHGSIVLLPQGLRNYLADSKFLTRIFLFLDDARYQSMGTGQLSRIDRILGSIGSIHKPITNYCYVEPEFTNEIDQELSDLPYQPLISIIMPVFDVDSYWLSLAVQSIEKQWYRNWELCIVDDHSGNHATINYLKSLNNPAIKIQFASKNCGISASSNTALALTKGEYIALIDHDDELTVDALYQVVKAINEYDAEFIYSDEDKLAMDGTFREPHFKPDFSPDTFLSQNYLSHFGVIKKTLVEKAGGFTVGVEGAQDYDLYLKVLEQTDKVIHIPRVLYHWRKIPGSTASNFDDKSYAWDAGHRALAFAIKRRRLSADVFNGKYPGTYRVKYVIKNAPLVSIIIPFKDKPELLNKCIGSILEKSTYSNYEVIGISNDSQEDATFTEMQRLEALDTRIAFHEFNKPFNYPEINNHAVSSYAKGEHIILLNNDIEIINDDWIESLLEFSQQPRIGVVGGKLFYPNGQIQHAGIIIGLGGIAGHSHKYQNGSDPGYFLRPNIVQNLSAITGACLMVKKDIYHEVNGLDAERLKIAFNDVDFCLRVREKGYLNVYTPYCEAYHHESLSRGSEQTEKQRIRFSREVNYMARRHEDILKRGDPYYNRQLSLQYEDFSLTADECLSKTNAAIIHTKSHHKSRKPQK